MPAANMSDDDDDDDSDAAGKARAGAREKAMDGDGRRVGKPTKDGKGGLVVRGATQPRDQ